eukprot:gene11745-biopygen6614
MFTTNLTAQFVLWRTQGGAAERTEGVSLLAQGALMLGKWNAPAITFFIIPQHARLPGGGGPRDAAGDVYAAGTVYAAGAAYPAGRVNAAGAAGIAKA